MFEHLHVYSLQALYWQKYAEMELDEPDPSRAKIVFSRSLLNCPIVKLWSLYLRFIKKVDFFGYPWNTELDTYHTLA